MASDIPSISDLEAIQLLNKHYAEVITSKEGGVSSAADITQTTNPITGVTRRTLYKILDDMDVEHDAQISAHESEHDAQISAHESEHDAQISAHESEHDAQISAHESEHDNQMQSFENDFDRRLAGMAFTRVGTFAAGATLTDMRQTLLWEVSQGGDGHEYGWSGSFPKVVSAGTTPATSGGIGAGAWVDRTDETLRSDINVVVKRFVSVSHMVADASLQLGQIVETLGYYGDWVSTASKPKGGNRYEIVAAATGTADGGSFIDLANGLQAKGLFVDGIINVCQFGARGDGVSSDHTAFTKVAALIQTLGGGHIVIPYGDYIVGQQAFVAGVGFTYSSPFQVKNCDTVTIESHGASIKYGSGFKFGRFDATTGEAVGFNLGVIATLGAMFKFDTLNKLVILGNLDLDGNDTGQTIGGGSGDVGWQIEYDGIYAVRVPEVYIANVKIHHFLCDGLYLGGIPGETEGSVELNGTKYSRVLTDVISEYNARQGLSLTGGSNWTFNGCIFAHTGRGVIASKPSAGVDIEAEFGRVKNITFNACQFINNKNSGVVADIAPARYVHFYGCKFKESNYATYIQQPYFYFDSCIISGNTLVLGNATTFIEGRTRFQNCHFTDDITFNPWCKTGATYYYDPGLHGSYFNCTFHINNNGFCYASNGDWHACKIIYGPDFGNKWLGRFAGYIDDVEIIDDRTDPSAAVNVNSLQVTALYVNNLRFSSDYSRNIFVSYTAKGLDTYNKASAKAYTTTLVSSVYPQGTIGLARRDDVDDVADLLRITTLTASPSSGEHAYYKGDCVLNGSPSSTSNLMWVCTTSGYAVTTEWVASTDYSVGTLRFTSTRVYKCTVAGTTGTTAPTHTTGTAVDGTVTWEYLGVKAVFRAVGSVGVAVTPAVGADDTSVKLNALITSLKNAGYLQ